MVIMYSRWRIVVWCRWGGIVVWCRWGGIVVWCRWGGIVTWYRRGGIMMHRIVMRRRMRRV